MKSALVLMPFFIKTSFDFFSPAMAPKTIIEVLPLLTVGTRHSLLNFSSIFRQTLGCEDSLPFSKFDSSVQITPFASHLLSSGHGFFLQRYALLFASWQPPKKPIQVFSVSRELFFQRLLC